MAIIEMQWWSGMFAGFGIGCAFANVIWLIGTWRR